MPSPRLLRCSALLDLGLLAAAGFTAGALWEGPGAWAALLAAGIAMPRLGLAQHKTRRRRQTLHRLIAERRRLRRPPAPPPHPLAGLGEEMKPPLNAIIGYSALLAGEPHGPLAPAYGEYVQSVHAASRQLKSLVDAGLELERIRDGSLNLQEQETDPAELAEVAQRLCQPQARGAGVLITLDAPLHRLEIRGDTARLQQILTSLIQSAIACAAKGTSVRLSAHDTPSGGLAFHVKTSGTQGFPAGISLTLAQALAQLHGGALVLEPGCARFTLPAARVTRA